MSALDQSQISEILDHNQIMLSESQYVNDEFFDINQLNDDDVVGLDHGNNNEDNFLSDLGVGASGGKSHKNSTLTFIPEIDRSFNEVSGTPGSTNTLKKSNYP